MNLLDNILYTQMCSIFVLPVYIFNGRQPQKSLVGTMYIMVKFFVPKIIFFFCNAQNAWFQTKRFTGLHLEFIELFTQNPFRDCFSIFRFYLPKLCFIGFKPCTSQKVCRIQCTLCSVSLQESFWGRMKTNDQTYSLLFRFDNYVNLFLTLCQQFVHV